MKNILFPIILITVVLSACNEKHQEQHDHDADEVKVQYTAYSNDFEVFAEADRFIVGESASVLSHFSHIPSFEALEKGVVTIRLTCGAKEVSQVLDKPTRKGIYKFDIKPEQQGKAKLIFNIRIENNESQIEVPEVVVYASDEEADKVTIPSVGRTNTSSFTKEQSWKIEFGTDYPMVEPFGQVIKTSAIIQSAQGDEDIVIAKTSGVVAFRGESILEGKSVAAGQTLLTISGNGLVDNSSSVRFVEAQNNYEKASADYERIKELAKDKIASEKELLEAKNIYENAKAEYDNLRSSFSQNGQAVSSRINGYVKQIFVKNGQYVESGQPVLVISQNKTLLLQADVQQKYAKLLGTISSANIRIPQENQTYTLEQLNGKVLSYGKNASQDNYLIPVNIKIDNKADFVGGGIVEVYLKTITSNNAITVPNTSLVEEQGNFYVYVQVTPELFEKREVKVGVTDGIKSEVVKGLTAKERIVTKGAIQIKLAQATGALDAHSGHVH